MSDANQGLDNMFKNADIPTENVEVQQERTPVYKVVGSSKIPVSSAMGKVWKSRRDQALTKRKTSGIEQSWDEALAYYRHNQMSHRTEADGHRVGNRVVARRLNDQLSETENVVFANISALVPAIYAKNPRAEITVVDRDDEDMASMLEVLLNTMSNKAAAPGFDLKPKARRCVVMTALTNRSYLEVGYTTKEQSSDQALLDLQLLSDKLTKAENKQEIAEIEGALMALEQRIDLLQPEGPWVKFRRPHQVLIDPDADDDNLSDANWIMIKDYVSTDFIRAVYMTKDESGDFSSIYEPSHVIKLNGGTSAATDSLDDEVNSFSLLNQATTPKSFGYDSEDTFRRAQRTLVWYVWDRVTRRVYLFNDKNWNWPIWVWDDPLQLDTFFPIFPLSFYTDPEGGEAIGEVTYYLDQQDAINEINSETRQARSWARRNIFYNSSVIDKDDVEKFLSGPDGTAAGVKLPVGTKLSDVIFSLPPPSMAFTQLFDTQSKFAAIDRISSVTDIMRGAQYKTNTTNQAIQQYNSQSSARLDEKIDALEDMLGKVYWAIGQLCLMHMTKEQVAGLIGAKRAEAWQNLSTTELRQKFNAQIVGGSSVKPTTQAKKKDAMELGQVLGQFTNAAPAAILVALQVMSSAFEEVNLTKDDWDLIREQLMQKLQMEQGPPNPAQASAPQGAPPSAAPSNSPASADSQAQVEQLIDSLPPPAKEALGKAIAQGVPIREAVARIMERVQTPQQTAQ